MVAAAAVFGTVALSAWSDRGGESTVHAVVRTDTARGASSLRATTLESIGTRADFAEATSEMRTSAFEAATADEGFLATLRVVDASTGLTIPTAWFQRSEFGALDRRAQRHDAAPGKESVRLWIDGTHATVLVAAPRYQTKDVALDRAGAHDVRLERATSLGGTVRDGQSAPVPAALITLEYLGSTLDGLSDDAEPLAIKGPTLRRTDADGRYAFTDLAPGVYRTVATIDGAVHTSRPRLVHAGEWVDTDHWLDEATRLVVQVDGPDGLPAARARLLVSRKNTTLQTLTRYTDRDGRATLGPLEPGIYDVTVQSTDGVAEPHSFTIEDDGSALVDLHIQLAIASAPRD